MKTVMDEVWNPGVNALGTWGELTGNLCRNTRLPYSKFMGNSLWNGRVN